MFGKIKKAFHDFFNSHRSDDKTNAGLFWNFLIPKPTFKFFLRVGIIIVLSVIIFSTLLIPCWISGGSMEPTVKSIGFNFCWRGKYMFGKKPQRGDIVIIRYTKRVFYLKRIVALPDEEVAFANGHLYVNGKKQTEPYVKYASDWKMPPRIVDADNYYVIGDNRSMPLENHKFGQVPEHRIIGAPLW